MPLFGELFLSEVIRKPVFDPKGDTIGRVKDIVVVKGEPFPKVASLIVEKNGQFKRRNQAKGRRRSCKSAS